MVNYQTKDNAISKGLAYVQSDGTTVMTVDPNSTLSSGEYRDSVRVSSKNTYSNGLIIADIWAMPHGCSVWPAYWMVGPSWPSDGEIDILEGVNGEFSFILSLIMIPPLPLSYLMHVMCCVCAVRAARCVSSHV